MSVLTNVLHFRGETVTLYATFKQPTAESAMGTVSAPQVKIQYATPAGTVVTILPASDMIAISGERFFYNWTIPLDAPLTAYTVAYSGYIGNVLAGRTEDLVVGNPTLTMNRRFLRYGPFSYLLLPRTPAVARPNPALPRGEF
jgi:hypothetical protein